MTQFEIYKYVSALINADDFGGMWNIPEYNYAIKDYNLEFFKKNVEEFYVNKLSGTLDTDLVYSSKLLRPFIMSETEATPNIGVTTAFTNFAYILGIRTSAAYNGQIRRVKLVDHAEFNRRLTNLLMPPMDEVPVAKLTGNNLNIFPQNIPSVDVDYLRYPATPVLDYYINSSDEEVYLAPGTTHLLTSGESGSGGETSGTTVTSNSVELEYPSEYHNEFIHGLLGKLGITMRDQLIIQKSEIDTQKDEAK